MRPVRAPVIVFIASLGLSAAAVAQTPVAAPAYDPRVAFAETDTNKDGAVDYHELIERITEVYYFNDTDKDGRLEPGEGTAVLVVTDHLLGADGDGDGHLTVHELLRARLQSFTVADTNKDGLLSVDEVVTVYESKP
jgi:Ca2+-binding EF-hand superfamily protein